MLRDRITKFLNKHIYLQGLFFTFIFLMYLTYIILFSYDLFSITNSCITNANNIDYDNSIVLVDEYIIDGKDIKINGKDEYKDVNFNFYGISTDDDSTYFSVDSNTLLQRLPNNFFNTLFLSTNFYIVLLSLILMILLFCKGRGKLSLLNNRTCILFSLLGVLMLVDMFIAIILLM